MKKTVRALLFATILFLPFHAIIVNLVNFSLISYWKEAIIISLLYLMSLGIFLSDVRFKHLFNRSTFFVWLFVIIIVISTLLHFSRISLYGFAAYVLYIIFYFLLIAYISQKQINQFFYLLFGVGIILAVGALLQMLVAPSLFGFTIAHWLVPGEEIRAGSFMGGSPGVLGVYLSFLIPVAAAFYLMERKETFSLIYLCISLLMAVGVILTFSRAAWFYLLFSLFSLLFLIFFLRVGLIKQILRRLTTVLILGLVVYFALINFTALSDDLSPQLLMKRFFSSFDFQNDPSNVGRLERWKITLSFVTEKTILLGAGPGLGWFFGTVDTMSESELFQALEKTVAPGGRSSTESFYLLVLVELGVVGLLAFLLLQLRFIWSGIRAISRSKFQENRSLPIILGVTAALIGYFPFASLTNWSIVSLFWFYCAIVTISQRELYAETK